MHDDIVDAHAAGGGASGEGVLFRGIFAEVVGRQRAGLAVDVVDGVFKVLVSANRQQWAENFVLQNFQVFRRLGNQRRGNLQGALLGAEILVRRVQWNNLLAALIGLFQVAVWSDG